jgi:hypothetical protein
MRKIILILTLLLVFSACEKVEKELVLELEQVVEQDDDRDPNTYYNENFDYNIALKEGFETEYLLEGEGIVLKRRDEYLDEDELSIPYTVELGISAYENTLNYERLGDYLAAEYAGYTMDFDEKGVFVNEDSNDCGIRSFIMMSDNMNVIYKAHLKVPRIRFNYHKEGFEDWAKTLSLSD